MIEMGTAHYGDAVNASAARALSTTLIDAASGRSNRLTAMRRTRVAGAVPRSILCLTLICLCHIPAEARLQHRSQGGAVLRAQKKGLLDVHLPDVEKLEPSVRKQILSFQDSLAALSKVNLSGASETTYQKLSEAYGLMGQIYHAYALNSPAEECYQNAHRLERQDFRWVYLLGNLLQQESRVEEAIYFYRFARGLRPDYLAASVNLGNLYLQQDRLEEARASFKLALGIDGKSAAAQYGLGQVALSERKYAEAVEHLQQALTLIPSANRIHYVLAMAYRGLGDVEKAQEHLAQQGPVGVRAPDPLFDSIQRLVEGERAHLQRGRMAFDARRYAEAADEFHKAVAASPDSVAARVNLGSALAQTGDTEGAIEQFKAALRLDPRNSAAHYNLGFLFAKQNQHEEAISHLRAITAEEDTTARRLLADQLLKAGRAEDALVEFSSLVDSNPDDEDALLEQVNLLVKKKDYRKALQSLEKGHRLFPQKGLTAITLAYLLAACPQYDLRDGARALALAMAAYRSSGSINHGAIVAMALAELGRCSEAIDWQRKMIAAAEWLKDLELVEKLKAELAHYETANPCRPSGNTPRASGKL
jgi:tetratricopeptide (TPR) repeat protein